jgi:response regulator RpfG family c-di-GMP phosphodiesterase
MKVGDRNLAPFRPDEKSAITALGGQVEAEEPEEEEEPEPPVVVALGSDAIFRALFWKLSVLGGRAVAKFDTIEGGLQYLLKRNVHSVLIDASLPAHEAAKFVRQVRTTQQLKHIGLFVVGAPSRRGAARSVVEEGAHVFIPFSFTGEEIVSKLDARAFFAKLKEVYERFDARSKAKEKS